MVKQRCIKRGFLTIIVVCFFIMTLKICLELRQLEKHDNHLRENFDEKDLETYRYNDEMDWKSSVVSDELLHSKKTKTLEKPLNGSKCGYSVS